MCIRDRCNQKKADYLIGREEHFGRGLGFLDL